MELKILSKKETETLETSTVPIEVITGYGNPHMEYYFKINFWYNVYDIKISGPQKNFVEKLSELLGHNPLYSKNYEYRTAVWGFGWKNEHFLLYRSERGLQIQIKNDFNKDKLEVFLSEFSTMLGTNNVKTPNFN
jgi:hypothetical protein